jgi:hypothetical protein
VQTWETFWVGFIFQEWCDRHSLWELF